jgi:hypothetical protein
MSSKPSNSSPSTDTLLKIRQEPSRNNYRRRDFDSEILSEDMAKTIHADHQNRNLDDKQNTPPTEKDREILDPKKQDQEIVDPERKITEREFPQQEETEDINPEKIVPKTDIYYLTDEEGDIIKEPTRELDDPYRPGQTHRKNSPPIKKESPNPQPIQKTAYYN